MSYTVSELDKIEPFIEGVQSGRIPNPRCCALCKLYDTEIHDCTLCCHPPIESVMKQPNWCPIRAEVIQ